MKLKKEQQNKKLVVIAGATASGKTSLAVKVAKELKSEVISVDSRQVYKEMNIGTAKPSVSEMQGVTHNFIGNVSVKADYDVGVYEKEVISFLSNYFLDNDVAILCGGTGFYIDSITKGLDTFPKIDPKIKSEIQSLYEEQGIVYLQEQLELFDLDYYNKVDRNNSHRLIRALSVIKQTGKPFSEFLKGGKTSRNFDVIYILLDLPRDILYDRINKRVDNMINEGLETEARKLYAFRDLKAMQTVGYKELFEYFDGNISLSNAIDLIKRNTRRYAKRQMTWFRNRGEWNVFLPNDLEGILKLINDVKN